MRYEILNDDGEVINAIIATAEFVEANYPGKYREVVEVTPAPQENDEWIIEVAAWFDRFDWCCESAKQLQLLADEDPVCRALVKMSDVRIKQGINLKSASLPVLLQKLVDAGKITPGEAIAIRTTPPKPEERFKKG